MINSFRIKLTAAFFMIIILILLANSLIISIILKNYYINDVKSNLINEAKLVRNITDYCDEGQSDLEFFVQNVAYQVAKDTNSRVSIINQNGKVIADSDFDASNMELHNNRPEIITALKGEIGSNIRLSDTNKKQMLYVAIPFENSIGKGVIRLAKSLNEIKYLYKSILYTLLLSILFTGVIVLGFSILIAKKFAVPIQEITKNVEDIANGNLKKRITYKSNDELGILATMINNMSDNLEKTISEISEVKNLFENLLKNSVNGILMIDTKNTIIYANPAATKLFPNNYIGRKYVEVIDNYDLINCIDYVMYSLMPIHKEIIIYNSNEIIVDAHIAPICDKQEIIFTGVLVILNNITELKRLEEVRKDFVSNVSHELKTPIATISGFAETLVNVEVDKETVQEFSKLIYEETKHLDRLISRLLELSKIESGKHKGQMEALVLKDIINNAIKLISKRFNNRHLNINIKNIDDKLIVKGDYYLITQVLLNIIENAICYSKTDEEIMIEVIDLTNEVKIIVTDKGEGIPEQDLPRIFERFYRVDKARSKKTGGTGLGLSIVKHIVENQGGTVGVTSQIGEGTSFFFTLPKI